MKLTAEQFQQYKSQLDKVTSILDQLLELYKESVALYGSFDKEEGEENRRRREMTESLAMNSSLIHAGRMMLREALDCITNNLLWARNEGYLSDEDAETYRKSFPDPMEAMLKELGLIQEGVSEISVEVGTDDLTALDPSIGKPLN